MQRTPIRASVRLKLGRYSSNSNFLRTEHVPPRWTLERSTSSFQERTQTRNISTYQRGFSVCTTSLQTLAAWGRLRHFCMDGGGING